MSPATPTLSSSQLVASLRDPSAYPDPFDSPVVVHETHISWVFLAGDWAYKVKKPIKTDFLDYSTLDRREALCHEELRLDRRFARELYQQVVPIANRNGSIAVEGSGEAIEYAVKMSRFPEDALMSHRLQQGQVKREDVFQLAASIAAVHATARRSDPQHSWGCPEMVLEDAVDNLTSVQAAAMEGTDENLEALHRWTIDFAESNKMLISQRVANGFIRECHGDLHLENVIRWRDTMVPFDGIEFNDRFRWIDVLSDAAFLAMDFAARGRDDLGRSFINAYLEQTGDHASLLMLRWYLVFRAMVRAKVAAIRSAGRDVSSADRQAAIADCQSHVDLARRFTLPAKPAIWITHGLSGSGKTRGSEATIEKHGAIRFRSDIERKRHYGFDVLHRPTPRQRRRLYSAEASGATYCRLHRLAHNAVHDGFAVVVDAAFLKHDQRSRFRALADSLGASFTILDFQADQATLRRRLADRLAHDTDASDADAAVLERQLAMQEPLRGDELRYVVTMSDIDQQIES